MAVQPHHVRRADTRYGGKAGSPPYVTRATSESGSMRVPHHFLASSRVQPTSTSHRPTGVVRHRLAKERVRLGTTCRQMVALP
jgi:hypothetical protein